MLNYNGVHLKLIKNDYFKLWHKLPFYAIPYPNQFFVLAYLGFFFSHYFKQQLRNILIYKLLSACPSPYQLLLNSVKWH